MIKIENLNFNNKNFKLENINLEILKNEYCIILGPTGSGKTTLLKCILGLNKIVSGKIFINEKEITNISTEDRNIGFLPQNYLLFPNFNVYDNIAYALKIRKKDSNYIKSEITKNAEIFNITNLLDRNINSLSGGEKQKVALARILVTKPDILLLDEPFSSIDENFKTEICFELKNMLKKLQIPVIHITHNLDEAYALGDKIVVIIQGKINQIGTPYDIFNKPANIEVAKFVGIKNIFDVEIVSVANDKIILNLDGIELSVTENNFVTKNYFSKGCEIKFCIKPESIKIIRTNETIRPELEKNIFDAKIVSTNFYSDICLMKIKLYKNLDKDELSQNEFFMRFPIYIYSRYNLSSVEKIKIGFWEPGILIY